MHRVVRQVRIGDVPLYAVDMQVGGDGAASAVFHHVADALGAGRLADQAVIQPLVARHQRFDHLNRAVGGAGLFIRGDQECQAAPVIRVGGDKSLGGHHHCGQ